MAKVVKSKAGSPVKARTAKTRTAKTRAAKTPTTKTRTTKTRTTKTRTTKTKQAKVKDTTTGVARKRAAKKSSIRRTPGTTSGKSSTQQASSAAASAARPTSTTAFDGRIRVRMYRHGLGDCFLIRLPKSEAESFNVMIDCGVIGAKKFGEAEVVEDILAAAGGKIDLLVVTHEHEDHVSGFRVAKELLQGKVKRVWMGWTEDPDDALATKLRKERETRKAALHVLMDKLTGENPALANGVAGILGFFALDSRSDPKKGKTRQGLDNARNLVAADDLRYCRPKDAPVRFAEAPNFRFYVLGPPPNEMLIRKTDDKSERYPRLALSSELNLDAFAAAAGLADLAAAAGLADSDPDANANADRHCPFDRAYRLPMPAVEGGAVGAGGPGPARSRPGASELDRFFDLHYFGDAPVYDGQGGGEQRWRRIDGDWLSSASDFALQLDRFTNNTSLALAIEHVPSRRVLLFAADAQVGNWLSWQDLSWRGDDGTITTGPDLLKRTVFYKVGHHGSENATLSEKGLQQMASSDLVAFIPVFETTAQARNWNFMPLERLVKELERRTKGRTVHADKPFAPIPKFDLVSGPNDLFYEYVLPVSP